MRLPLFTYMVALWASLVLSQRPECDSLPRQQNPDLADRANQLFRGFTYDETQQIIEFLLSRPELNLTRAVNASLTDNYIYSIENVIPKKTLVTEWLDGKRSKAPMRMAQAILFMGQTRQVADLIVAPIPNPTVYMESKINYKNGKKISWISRPVGGVEGPVVVPMLLSLLEPLTPMLNSIVTNYCEDFYECATLQYLPRASIDSPLRHLMVYFTMTPQFFRAYYVLPLPLYAVVSYNDDTESVSLREISLNGVSYASVAELMEEYENNPTDRFVLPEWNDDLSLFGTPDFLGEDDTADDLRRPPAQFYPDGQRFRIDGHHVEWLKWSFNIHTRTIAGLQLFDVRYDGERIAYEMSIQDIAVIYTGYGPDNYFKTYFDNSFGVGRMTSSLIRGVDCPEGSEYLDIAVYATEFDDGMLITDAVCIFEHRNSVPIRRHFSAGFDGPYRFAFSMPDSVLIVRQILTISNYDYIYDFELHQNGVIEAKATSTGYVQMANNIPRGETKYGLLLQPAWNDVGLFHHHVFNFKFDVDIGGTCNNFKTMNFGAEKASTKYSNGKPWYVPVVNETVIEYEEDAKIKYNFDKPKQFVIYEGCGRSDEAKRGYRVHSNGFSRSLLPEDSPMIEGALSWTKYQLAVSKYSDDERTTTSYFLQGKPFEPDVNFDEFLSDNDRIVDTDLVAWIAVGIHHLPTNEDMPVTTTTGKTLKASLYPFNYFPRDPSIYSRDAVLLYGGFDLDDDYLHWNDTCEAVVNEPALSLDERF